MNNYKLDDFIKRVKVKGYPRMTRDGKIYMVSPHYRVVKRLDSNKSPAKPRPKLI